LTAKYPIASSQPAQLTKRRSIAEEPSSSVSQLPKSEPASITKRRGRRPITQSRFKGFDDFDVSELPKTRIPGIEEDEKMQDTSVESPEAPSQPVANPRKRPSSPPAEDEDAVIDDLLPAAAAMKRRRLNRNDASVQPQDRLKPATESKVIRKPNKVPQVDVLEVARSKREAEEEAARKDAESLKEAMDGMDIVGPAKLVDVEEMKIEPREKVDRGKNDAGDRWDERWTGRKNFKKFRRKGEAQPMRGHRLLVPLEEAKKKDFGIGEEYWLEPGNKQKRRGAQRESQAASAPTQTLRAEDDDDSQFRRRHRNKKNTTQSTAADEVLVVDESILPSPAVSSRIAETTQEATQTQTHKGRKRAAVETPQAVQPPAKKKGRLTRREEESGSSEDELRFRSRRKR